MTDGLPSVLVLGVDLPVLAKRLLTHLTITFSRRSLPCHTILMERQWIINAFQDSLLVSIRSLDFPGNTAAWFCQVWCRCLRWQEQPAFCLKHLSKTFCFEVYGLRIIQASSPDANPADVWTYDVICGNKSRGFSRLVMGRLSLWRILLAFVDVLDLNLWHVFEKNEHYVVLLTSYCCGVAVSVDMTHLRFEMVGNWWHL